MQFHAKHMTCGEATMKMKEKLVETEGTQDSYLVHFENGLHGRMAEREAHDSNNWLRVIL